MNRSTGLAALAALLGAVSLRAAELPLVVVDHDDVEIRDSCRLAPGPGPIPDLNGNGVVRVIAAADRTEPLVIELVAPLRGASPERSPDRLDGVGIHVTGPGVVLRGPALDEPAVQGYRVAIEAVAADGLLVEDLRFAGNFRQRLGSTPEGEDAADWLRPHENDDGEWLARYGAAVAVRNSRDVTVRRVTVRAGQNGIVLDRVTDSRVYDNDCSFLSGWGLALWRSSRTMIARNALDFCVRGYVDGVYNRGQDSAGLLMFEQCHDNVVGLNSITHGGDGIFAFSGREALGEVSPRDDAEWYAGRGNVGNVFVQNDLSFAAAHGLELTFAFDSQIRDNRFVGNAICGVWAGYSQQILVAGNTFERNGNAGYGLERGGVNIEHGVENVITGNVFRENACGVHLWMDDDPALAATPWVRANARGGVGNLVVANRHDGDVVGVHLRDTVAPTVVHLNVMNAVAEEQRLEGTSPVITALDPNRSRVPPVVARRQGLGLPALVLDDFPGERDPIGARRRIGGRGAIVMTEWGPWDHERPAVQPRAADGSTHRYRLLGVPPETAIEADGVVAVRRDGDDLLVSTEGTDRAAPYTVTIGAGADALTLRGTLVDATWQVLAFPWTSDPRVDLQPWQAEARAGGVAVTRRDLHLDFAAAGPGALDPAWAAMPDDRFGIIAYTTVTLPPGRWRVRTRSDDGIRVWVDERTLIDEWTWHPPTVFEAPFVIVDERPITVRVQHFELDGYAVLECDLIWDGPRNGAMPASRPVEPSRGHGPPQRP